MSKKPDITVAIPTYQREEVLINTIHELLKQSHHNLELLIVDQSKNHSGDTEKALSAITDPRFRYVRATPPSLPGARNLSLKLARAPLVLFLDDDIVPTKDLIKYHLQAFVEHPEISVVAGRVMQHGFPVKPNVLRFDEYATSHGVFTATKAAFTNTFPGGNHAMRVADAWKVGGFETRYYYNAFREESDMAMRMVRAGMKIYYEPRAEILHLAAPTGGTRTRQYSHIYDSRTFYGNELFFTLRAVAPGKRVVALHRKYQAYCFSARYFRGYRRRVLFCFGLLAALWRMHFGRRIETEEIA